MGEEEYRKSVWERAIFEGDLKYRMMRGQNTDERKELADFKSQQEKKKEVMLERAKASLQELLDEDDRENGNVLSCCNNVIITWFRAKHMDTKCAANNKTGG